jgi:hypothetical protein
VGPFSSDDYPQRLPRVPFDRPIQVGEGAHVSRLRACNLSLGGMFVEANRPPKLGTRLSIALDTARPALHLGEAEVVWRVSDSTPGTRHAPSRYGFGLRFVSLVPTAQSLVEAMVRHGGTSSIQGARAISPEAPTRPEGYPILDDEPDTDPGLN